MIQKIEEMDEKEEEGDEHKTRCTAIHNTRRGAAHTVNVRVDRRMYMMIDDVTRIVLSECLSHWLANYSLCCLSVVLCVLPCLIDSGQPLKRCAPRFFAWIFQNRSNFCFEVIWFWFFFFEKHRIISGIDNSASIPKQWQVRVSAFVIFHVIWLDSALYLFYFFIFQLRENEWKCIVNKS